MNIIKLCSSTITALATAFANAVADTLGNTLADIIQMQVSAGVVSHTYCGTDADGNHVMVEFVTIYESDGTVAATTLRNITDPSAPTILANLDGITLDITCCDKPAEEGFNFAGLFGGSATKVNLDNPAFDDAYFAVPDGWTVADLVTALNANAANAVPPTVPSGIDYSSTVFGVSGSNPDVIVVTAGPVPTSIDLVSDSVSIPVTTI